MSVYLQQYNIPVSTFVAKYNTIFSKRTRDLKILPRATLRNNRPLVGMSVKTADKRKYSNFADEILMSILLAQKKGRKTLAFRAMSSIDTLHR
jgi:hypothetical protein